MCGIIAYTGKQRIDIDKLKLLMMFSRKRGTDSCGFWYNEKRIIGYNRFGNGLDTSDSVNLFKHVIFKKSKNSRVKNKTVIAHTRRKSYGLAKAENAHPFEITDDNDNILIIGCHNGTLHKSGMKRFLEKWKLDSEEHDVDSYFLLKALALNRDNMGGVLSSYIGTAALAFSFPDDPGSLYLWSGESTINQNTSANHIERPLHYYQNKTGIYFASEENFLTGTFNVDLEDIQEVPSNTLMYFKNGELIESVKYSRDKASQELYYSVQTTNNRIRTDYGHGASTIKKLPASTQKNSGERDSMPYSSREKAYSRFLMRQKKNATKQILLLSDIPTPVKIANNRIYEWKLRYWRNGHLAEGEYLLSPDGLEISPKDLLNDPTIKAKLYYFYKGIMVFDQKSIDILKTINVSGLKNYSSLRKMLNPEQILFKGDRDVSIYHLETKEKATSFFSKIPFSYYNYRIEEGELLYVHLKVKHSKTYELKGKKLVLKENRTNSKIGNKIPLDNFMSNIKRITTPSEDIKGRFDNLLNEEDQFTNKIKLYNHFCETQFKTSKDCDNHFECHLGIPYDWSMSPEENWIPFTE